MEEHDPPAEARFRAMIRYSADIVAVVDGSGRLIEASPAAVEVLDLDPDDLVGRSMFDLIHPEDRAPVAKALRDAVAGRADREPIMLRVQSGSGEWRDLEVTGHVAEGGSGGRGDVVVVAHDVTDRKKQEDLLPRLRAALPRPRRSSLAVARRARRHRAVHVRGRLAEAVARLGSRRPRSGDRELLVPEDRPAFDSYFAEVVARRGIHPPRVCRVVDRFGVEHYLEVVANNLLEDPLVKGVVLDAGDVTAGPQQREVATASTRSTMRSPGWRTARCSSTGSVKPSATGSSEHRPRWWRSCWEWTSTSIKDDQRLARARRLVTRSSVADRGHCSRGERRGHADTVARLAGTQFGVCWKGGEPSQRERGPGRGRGAGRSGHDGSMSGSPATRRAPHGNDWRSAVRGERGRHARVARPAMPMLRKLSRATGEGPRAGRVARERAGRGSAPSTGLEVENGTARAAPASTASSACTTSRSVRWRTARSPAREALVRWQHPNRAVCCRPTEFIPIAEETGLIKSIGGVGDPTGVQRRQRMGDRSPGSAMSPVAVNVSARPAQRRRQSHGPCGEKRTRRQLTSPPTALTLEITGTALMGENEETGEGHRRATARARRSPRHRRLRDGLLSSLSNLRKVPLSTP